MEYFKLGLPHLENISYEFLSILTDTCSDIEYRPFYLKFFVETLMPDVNPVFKQILLINLSHWVEGDPMMEKWLRNLN